MQQREQQQQPGGVAAAPGSPFRLGGLTGDHPLEKTTGWSFWVAVAFTINYIM